MKKGTGSADAARPPVPAPTLADALQIVAESLADLPHRERAPFVARLQRWWPDLTEGWSSPYGRHPDGPVALERLVRLLARAYRARSTALRSLDQQRVGHPDWFQEPGMVGYVCYVDRFAGTIARIADHVGYLDELGIRYIHLMPLLRSRTGDNDGGYAVTDYRAVEQRLGTIDDLERLCEMLRGHGISVCIDLVLNHTAAEHPWAQRALEGDPDAERLYWIFPDRTEPDLYEATLPEVFPDFAPGNFSELDGGRWAWTTFHEFQWDLNWSNPDVFVAMADVLLDLVNRGVEVVRLDAVPFIWKEIGTNCQNRPQVHDLLQALRACARIVAPAVIFKAEAIVAPEELAKYLGVGRHRGRLADLAYHNSLMVQFWSGVATRDARLMRDVLSNFPDKPDSAAWATYIRNHDDIGWAVTDAAAAAVGWTGRDHRSFLSAFYSGAFAGSFARGEMFQFVPETGDSRISGTAASLAGIEAAMASGRAGDMDLAIGRVLLGYALIMAWNGLPLLYMGDEIGLLNDRSYLDEPDKADDSRWLHRPAMDWSLAGRRSDLASVAGRLFAGIQRLARARAATPQLHAARPLDILEATDPAVFAFVRDGARHPLVALYNVTDEPTTVDPGLLGDAGISRPRDLLDATDVDPTSLSELAPYAVRWMVNAGDRRRPS